MVRAWKIAFVGAGLLVVSLSVKSASAKATTYWLATCPSGKVLGVTGNGQTPGAKIMCAGNISKSLSGWYSAPAAKNGIGVPIYSQDSRTLSGFSIDTTTANMTCPTGSPMAGQKPGGNGSSGVRS